MPVRVHDVRSDVDERMLRPRDVDVIPVVRLQTPPEEILHGFDLLEFLLDERRPIVAKRASALRVLPADPEQVLEELVRLLLLDQTVDCPVRVAEEVLGRILLVIPVHCVQTHGQLEPRRHEVAAVAVERPADHVVHLMYPQLALWKGRAVQHRS